MANKHASLDALFTDIADAIRELTGDEGIIPAVEFPNMIRNKLELAPPPAYLTFRSPNSFTLAVSDATKHWDGTLEYSTDTSTWSTWDGTTTLSSVTNGSYNVLYLRGTGNTKICYYDKFIVVLPSSWVINGTNVLCDGNIETLLDYATVEAGQHPIMAEGCFYEMFADCKALIKPPELPATTLTNNCYDSMFYGCSNIKLSSTQTGEYTVAYRIPSSGTGTTATNALTDMFTGTGGTFKGTPAINTTYYLSNTNEVIGGPIVVDITASNISEYFTVTNGSSYYFKGNGNVFTTNNAGVNSSTASTILTAKQDISEIFFNYSYSSEPNYDKFTLKVAGSTIENAVSGATTTKSYNGSLASGQTIEFKYAKDSSVDRNDDKCTFSNMVIKLG